MNPGFPTIGSRLPREGLVDRTLPPTSNILLQNRNGRSIRIVVDRRHAAGNSYSEFLQRLGLGRSDTSLGPSKP